VYSIGENGSYVLQDIKRHIPLEHVSLTFSDLPLDMGKKESKILLIIEIYFNVEGNYND
jgi:hypothetical protein